jgi:hypothetical protein
MNKLIASLMLALAGFAQAATTSSSTKVEVLSAQTSAVVDYGAMPRMMMFHSERNAISVDGMILVCLREFRAKEGDCTHPTTGENAWRELGSIAPSGWKVVAYDGDHFNESSRPVRRRNEAQ